MPVQRSRRQRSLLSTVLVLSWLVTAPLLALPREKDRWIEVKTANFTLFSNSSRSNTREIANHLEQLRAVLGQLTSWNLNAPIPTHVYVFSNDERFEPYKPLYDGKPAELSGYFLARVDGNFIAIDGSSFHDPAKRIYHEYVHYLVNNNIPGVPLWLNEGLAECYSSFEISGKQAEIGRGIARHVDWLRQSPLIPLPELLAIDVGSPEYNEEARRGVFYAESWALVHYLLIGNREREGQLSRYLELVRASRHGKQAFREAFEADYETLEKELRDYVRGPTMPVLRIGVEELDDPMLEVRAMAYPEALVHLGNLLAGHEDRHEAAAEHFRAALKRQPADPLALAGLAGLAQCQGRHDEALALYRRAFKAGGDDFLLHFRYAECLLDDDDPGARVEAVSALRRSVALQARFTPAWSLLSAVRAELLALDLRKVEELLDRERHEDALRLLEELRDQAGPDDLARLEEEIRRLRQAIGHNRFADRYNEAVSLVNSGDLVSAKALLGELAAASEGSRAEQARALLEQIRRQEELEVSLKRVDRLLAQRRMEEAIEVLRQLDAAPGSQEGRWIVGRIAEIERAGERARFAERFNVALGHLDVGDARTACRVLEDLLATLPEDGPNVQRARQLLAKARAELKRRGG